jgi:hypothetical protein
MQNEKKKEKKNKSKHKFVLFNMFVMNLRYWNLQKLWKKICVLFYGMMQKISDVKQKVLQDNDVV